MFVTTPLHSQAIFLGLVENLVLTYTPFIYLEKLHTIFWFQLHLERWVNYLASGNCLNTQWRSGAVAQWRSGAVAQWRSGAVAQWRSGAVAQWRSEQSFALSTKRTVVRILDSSIETWTSSFNLYQSILIPLIQTYE